MIETIECKMIPATIMHRVTGNIDIEEVKRSINEANEAINKIIDKYGRFNLIIDLRGISFTDLAAHKKWKIWSQSKLTEKVDYIAIVLVYSPHTKAEKELMETETVQFFFDLHEGIKWLQSSATLK
ncbi:Uncharacterised protein [uncultured archaeon]|nr:Uncharacterised protein [uncultured archaeon]